MIENQAASVYASTSQRDRPSTRRANRYARNGYAAWIEGNDARRSGLMSPNASANSAWPSRPALLTIAVNAGGCRYVISGCPPGPGMNPCAAAHHGGATGSSTYVMNAAIDSRRSAAT